MADQVSTRARSMVERMFDPEIKDEFTKRGRAVVEALGDAAEMAGEHVSTTWKDAEPMRRDAARAGREALHWGRRTWIKDMQPGLSRLWSKRTMALGAAGAAVPVARELIDDAAVRMGIRVRRERRHWGSFFAGLLIGTAAGIIAAILTAPKAGREMRDELAVTAKDAATRAREVALRTRDEVAAKAREAAASAGEWVPIFQRPGGEGEANGEPNGEPVIDAVELPEVKPASSRKRAANNAPIEEADQPS